MKRSNNALNVHDRHRGSSEAIVAWCASLSPSMSTRRNKFGSTCGPVSFELICTKSMKREATVKSWPLISRPISNGVNDVTVNLMESFLLLFKLSSDSTVENPTVRQQFRITNTGTFRRSKASRGVMNESSCKLCMLFEFFRMCWRHSLIRPRTYSMWSLEGCDSKQICAERCHEWALRLFPDRGMASIVCEQEGTSGSAAWMPASIFRSASGWEARSAQDLKFYILYNVIDGIISIV